MSYPFKNEPEQEKNDQNLVIDLGDSVSHHVGQGYNDHSEELGYYIAADFGTHVCGFDLKFLKRMHYALLLLPYLFVGMTGTTIEFLRCWVSFECP